MEYAISVENTFLEKLASSQLKRTTIRKSGLKINKSGNDIASRIYENILVLISFFFIVL